MDTVKDFIIHRSIIIYFDMACVQLCKGNDKVKLYRFSNITRFCLTTTERRMMTRFKLGIEWFTLRSVIRIVYNVVFNIKSRESNN